MSLERSMDWNWSPNSRGSDGSSSGTGSSSAVENHFRCHNLQGHSLYPRIWICRVQGVYLSIISPLENSCISGGGTLPLNLMYPSDTLVIHDSHCKELELGTELHTGFPGHCTDEKAFPLEVSCRVGDQDPLLQYHSWASVWSHCQKESLK